MLSQENGNFIRIVLLLFTAGTKLLVKIMQNSLMKVAKSIDQLLTAPGTEEKIRRCALVTAWMREKLYPPNTVTRNVSEWDISLLSYIILEFQKQHLNDPEKLAVVAIRDIRNELVHKPEPAIDGNTFTDKWTHLLLILNTITYGMSRDDREHFNYIITSISKVDLSVALGEIKLSVLGCDEDIEIIHQNIKKLELLVQLDYKIEGIKVDMADLTRRTSDLERKSDTDSKRMSDLERKNDTDSKRMSDLERKILEIVLRIEAGEKHTKDDAEKHLYQASKDRLDGEPSNEFLMPVRENVDKLASEIEQEGNVITDVRKGSVIWEVTSKYSDARMQLEDFCNGPLIKKCVKNIAKSLETLVGWKIQLNLQIKTAGQTPHEVDVYEEMNNVTLRNKQSVPYYILQVLIEFCTLKRQNNTKNARHFFIQEIENVTANKNDLKEIELLGKEVTDLLHCDRQVVDNNLEISAVESLSADIAYKCLLKNNTLPVEREDIKHARRNIEFFFVFEPLMHIVDQIALGRLPAPHVSMRYELVRFCTLRSYPKEDKPYLIKLAEAGLYFASDGDGVVCYCFGIRRYNWTANDQPMKIHKRINPNCKFLVKNEEVNVRNNGPFIENLMFVNRIPEPVESQEPTEDVNNDWAPERTSSPAPRFQNNESTGSSSQLGTNTAIPKHSQYATKTSRLASFSGWPDTASHTPDILADAGFFYAGFGDCVRCFYCGIGLRHWTKDDNPWIEHARWAKNCVFVKQTKGEDFVNLVQLAVQYSQDNALAEKSDGNQLSTQEIENILLSDAAQSVLDMGYQPRIIKKAVEQIIRQNRQAKITAQFLMEKILEIEEGSNETPGSLVSPGAATSTVGATGITEGATGSSLNESLKESAKPEKKHKDDPSSKQDQKAIKTENERLKEQTICKICLDQTVSIVFLPCGHLVTCADCAPAMRKYPICRALVKGTVRTYL